MSNIFRSILDQYGIVACNIDMLLKLKQTDTTIGIMSRKSVTNNHEKKSPMITFFNNTYWAGDYMHTQNNKGDIILEQAKLLNKSGFINVEFDPRFFWVFFTLNKANTNIPVAQGRRVKRKGKGGNLFQMLLSLMLRTFDDNSARSIHSDFENKAESSFGAMLMGFTSKDECPEAITGCVFETTHEGVYVKYIATSPDLTYHSGFKKIMITKPLEVGD